MLALYLGRCRRVDLCLRLRLGLLVLAEGPLQRDLLSLLAAHRRLGVGLQEVQRLAVLFCNNQTRVER